MKSPNKKPHQDPEEGNEMTLTEAADPDALDRLAHHCDAAAQKIEDTYVPVRQAFHSSGWQGSDADQFATDWDGPSRARLTNTATALRDAATSLRRNANQQRAASDDTAGGGGGGPLGLSNELMRDLEEIIDGLGPGGLTGNQLVRDLEGLFGGGSILSNLADNQLIQLLGMTGGLLTLTR
ncbi:MAG: hypothetical protein JST73_02695, partial [Actinobacteria bacterium]|nr:hypothetical protein [Actinomycetota bacterium]